MPTLARKTIRSSEIKKCDPKFALNLTNQKITKDEIGNFLRLGFCTPMRADRPRWLFRISEEQRAMICVQAANFAPIKNSRKFWNKFKELIYGSETLRIIA
jgi:hypothetical protein